MQASLNGSVRRYFYNGARVLEITDDTNTTLLRSATEDDSYYAPLLQFQCAYHSGVRWYPLLDGPGNARRLVCLSGGTITPCDSHSQDAFGRMWGNPAQQPYRWGAAWGYLRDPSELVQLGARWYWPELGRFIQQDLARDGVNWYAYVDDNPLTGIDPEGLSVWPIIDAIFIGWDVYDLATHPSWAGAGALALDILPFVPDAAGVALRAGRTAEKVGHVAEAARAGGRLGGAAHRAKVVKTVERLEALGCEIRAGGGASERAVQTAHRLRYPDIIAAKNGVEFYVNVGRTTKAGRPVARERRALQDLGMINRTMFIPF